jgi:hypothetical protein
MLLADRFALPWHVLGTNSHQGWTDDSDPVKLVHAVAMDRRPLPMNPAAKWLPNARMRPSQAHFHRLPNGGSGLAQRHRPG